MKQGIENILKKTEKFSKYEYGIHKIFNLDY